MPYRVTFARLLGFLHPYKISLIVSTLLAIASQVAQIALVWVTAHVIDDAIIPRDSGKLWVYVWVIIGLGALRAAFMAARRLIFSYPRMDVAQSRPRVPSLYALEILRAAMGRLPELREFENRAAEGAQARLDWPAPRDHRDRADAGKAD